MNPIFNAANRCATAICSRLPSPVIKTKNGSLILDSKHTTIPTLFALTCISLKSSLYFVENESIINTIKLSAPVISEIAESTLSAGIVLFGVYSATQYLRAKKAFNDALITEFATKPFPSKECFEKISTNVSMLKEVIKRNKEALTKRSPEGKSLLQAQAPYNNDLDIIKLLLNSAKWESKEVGELLNYNMNYKNDKFKSICNPSVIQLLKPQDQHKLLINVPSAEAIDILKNAGLDINALNDTGHSPLFAISSCASIYTPLSKPFLANALIEAGADINAKFHIKEYSFELHDMLEGEFNALEVAEKISKDKDLIAVLKKRMIEQENLSKIAIEDEPDLS